MKMQVKRIAQKNKQERGIAVLMAIFALMLLSAVGLAMMYSATTETKINSNYRDKQIAIYASQSGALEARARLQPLNGDIGTNPPTTIPVSGLPGVIYIINPGPGETAADIRPWDYTNKYADTELCQEKVIGLTGTVGVPCTGSSSLPSGSTWYTTKTVVSPTELGTSPLTYKWTRISLKTNNMTGVAANGSATMGNQVCYDGFNQYVQATGANSNCAATGSVTGVNLTNYGSGYTSAPTVTLSGGGGTGATAVAHLNSSSTGQVTAVTITDQGHSYATAPTVLLVPNDLGLGATAVATINPPGSGPVNSVSLTGVGNPVGCYASGVVPSVTFVNGGGTGATAHANMSTTASCVISVSVTGACSNHKGDTDTITIPAAGGGSGFSATFQYLQQGAGAGSVVASSIQLVNPGTSYTFNPSTYHSYTSALGCSVTPTYTLGYTVASLSLDTGGSGYSSAPSVSIGASPSGGIPLGSAIVSGGSGAGKLASITITNPGANYTVAPTVLITSAVGDPGAGGAAVASLSPGLTIEVTNGGSGYTSAPTVSISGGGGSGAAATSVVGGGTYNGQVYMVTSMAQTASGSRALTQMELASPPRGFFSPGALTLDGPTPSSGALYGVPNSHNLVVSGVDANTCGEAVTTPPMYPPKPAVGVYDDPDHPTTTSAMDQVTAAITAAGRQDNYLGRGTNSPDVENVYSALGDMSTPSGMDAIATTVASVPGAHTYSTDPSNIVLGTSASPTVSVVNGDLTLSGNQHGYGILLVTGTLTMSGDFSWNGIIMVVGNGVFNSNGGGNGQIYGSVFVAKTRSCPASGCNSTNSTLLAGPDLGSPTVNWNGGGTNGITYDHCWTDNLLKKIPINPPPSSKPLKILSQRTVTY